MATKQQIIDYLKANPNLSDAELVSYMAQNQISPAQLAEASGAPVGQISAQIGATIPNGQTIQLGDTIVQPVYQVTGSGDSEQVGGIQNVITYKADENKTGGAYTQYTPTGEVERTGEQQKVKSGLKEFALGAGLLFGLPSLLNAGAGAAGTVGGTAFDLANAGIAGGTASFTPAQLALIEAGASAAEVAAAGTGAGLFSGAGSTLSNAAGSIGSTLGNVAGSIGTTLGNVGGNIGSTLGNIATTIGGAGTDLITKVGTGIGTNLLVNTGTPKLLSDAITSGLGLAGGVLQQQESKDAATAAAQNVNTATQAAVTGSQFRPVGMTTRFGTSQYTYDPVTGQMISAGYQLTPEAKAQQDRFATMANYSLTQAENAQSQFAPLQTAAQNLYSLGGKYIAKSPEEAAQDYINKQMQLIAPSREVDLANLQNRLFQQGRTGVSVAQGGSMGATTPELQALYNARAMQDLQLAANAQREGRENTLFGSNLYDLGTSKLSNYFGGQVQAYQPYQAAMGQVQNLESLGQQPLQMGASLGQQSATAGANAGRIGLTGAQISGGLMTSPAVTNNPYAAFLGGLASPTSTLGQGLANYITGYNQNVPPVTAMSAPSTGYGAGNYYGNQDVLGLWGV